jgi:hypothetical protein
MTERIPSQGGRSQLGIPLCVPLATALTAVSSRDLNSFECYSHRPFPSLTVMYRFKGTSVNRSTFPEGDGHFTSSQSIFLAWPIPRINRGSYEERRLPPASCRRDRVVQPKATVLFRQGKLEEAASELQLSRDLDPYSSRVRFTLAQVNLPLGRKEAAAREQEVYQQLTPAEDSFREFGKLPTSVFGLSEQSIAK